MFKILFKENLDDSHWQYAPRVQFILKKTSLGVKWKWRGYWYGLVIWERKEEDVRVDSS